MHRTPRAAFWHHLKDLIQINPLAASQFAFECYAKIAADGTGVDYLSAEAELQRLVVAQ